MVRSLVVTDNTVEKIEIKDYGERFALLIDDKTTKIHHTEILSPQEAETIAYFILDRKGGEDAGRKI